MDDTNLQGKLEALLFLYGEPVKVSKLAGLLNVEAKEINEAIETFSLSLKEENRGLFIVESGDRVQLTTKPTLGELLSKIAQDELDSGLTPASIETLAIVAYLGPCRRSLVEHIRGVNSSFILRSLLIRGLVDRKVDPKRTNTYTYEVTPDFLRHMGVGNIGDLPEYERYRDFEKLFTKTDDSSEVASGETDQQKIQNESSFSADTGQEE